MLASNNVVCVSASELAFVPRHTSQLAFVPRHTNQHAFVLRHTKSACPETYKMASETVLDRKDACIVGMTAGEKWTQQGQIRREMKFEN